MNDISEVYRDKIQTQLPEYDKRRHTVVEIKKGDAFGRSSDSSEPECSWTDSDVVFSNSTCFTKAMWEDYSHMTQHLKPGSFIVTTTGRFSSTPWLECVEASWLRQGWGSCGLFIHRRLPEGLSDPRNVRSSRSSSSSSSWQLQPQQQPSQPPQPPQPPQLSQQLAAAAVAAATAAAAVAAAAA